LLFFFILLFFASALRALAFQLFLTQAGLGAFLSPFALRLLYGKSVTFRQFAPALLYLLHPCSRVFFFRLRYKLSAKSP
jgi:hypothetical protein